MYDWRDAFDSLFWILDRPEEFKDGAEVSVAEQRCPETIGEIG